MFEQGARPHPPRDLYRAYLSQSDIFVGLFWQSYGRMVPVAPLPSLPAKGAARLSFADAGASVESHGSRSARSAILDSEPMLLY